MVEKGRYLTRGRVQECTSNRKQTPRHSLVVYERQNIINSKARSFFQRKSAHDHLFKPIQTGLFWSICDWGGGGEGLLGPPFCISGTNNARVMKFTHNNHLRTKKPHTQFWLATPNDDVTVTSYSDLSMFVIIFPLRYVKY